MGQLAYPIFPNISVLSKYWYGFHWGYNAQHCLITLIEKWKESVDNGGALLFDSFWWPALWVFNCQAICIWFWQKFFKIHSYLSNRKERVKLNDKYKSWSKKLFRNQQASGPLLLNIFMCNRFTFVRTLILHIMHTTLHRILRIKVPNLLSVIWSNHQQFFLNGLTISTRN